MLTFSLIAARLPNSTGVGSRIKLNFTSFYLFLPKDTFI
jgi:hypothetical protein